MVNNRPLTTVIFIISLLTLNACQAVTTPPPVINIPTDEPTVVTATAHPSPTLTVVTTPATGANSSATPALSGSGQKVCQVTDTAGIDDQSYNSAAWKGLAMAQDEFGVQANYLESDQPGDIAKNINTFFSANCSLIVTSGAQMSDDTKAAAEKNPNQKFAIVDFAYDPTIPNVLGLTFATDQAGFLAGYLAAGMTKTGKIGTFGGMQIPTVTIFMDGYYYGAKYYNEQNNAKVEVLGWDPTTQKGSFTGDSSSSDKAQVFAQNLLYQGVDIIMPVNGSAGVGAAEAVRNAGNAWIIGTGNDWTINLSSYKDIILTSAVISPDTAVFDTVKAVLDGSFKGGIYTGTVQNGGVGLSTINTVVPADLKARVDQVKADISGGKVKVNPNGR